MKTTALATILSFGLASAVFGQETAPAGDAATDQDTAEQAAGAERPPIPAEAEATLADCRIWVSTLGEMLETDDDDAADDADGDADDDARAEAEDAQDRANQACDDGNYYEGITIAAEAMDRLEGVEHDDAEENDEDHDDEDEES